MFLTHALRAILRTAVATGDALWKYVSLLLSGTPPTQTFISDASVNANVLTLNGDVRPSNLNPYVEGYYSNYFDGTGDWLTYTGGATTTLSGDFTLECWVYVTSFPTNQPIICIGDDYNLGALFYIDTAGKLGLFANNVQILLSAAAITTNNWNHVAYVRSGATTTAYINGVARGTGTSSSQWSGATTHIGREVYNTGTGILLSGYLSNLRLVKGTAVYTAAFTPSTAPLTAVSGTSLLTCQSNRFIDNSQNNFTITKSGDVSVRGFVPFTPPTSVNVNTLYSTYFDGTGDYLVTPSSSQFQFDSNLTIEFWVNFTSVAGTQDLLGNYVSNVSTDWIVIMSATGIQFYPSGSSSYVYSGGSSVTTNTWYHVAAVRSGSTCSLYVNGVSVGTPLTVSTAIGDGTKPVYIGARSGPSSFFSGNISNLRIVKGTAVYTANFTPPTSPLTAISGTSLLTCQNATLRDNSTNALTITSYGQAQPDAISPFTQVTTPVTATYLGSGYFDGTGDYITTASNGSCAFGSGDFTIEFWLYANSVGATDQGLIDMRPTSTNGYYPYLYMYSGQITYWLNATAVISSASGAITAGSWYHVALTRSGSSNKLFINGVQSGSTFTSTTALLCDNARPVFGSAGTSLGGSPLNGYIADVRIVKGTALYTANFAPPLQPLTAVANTQLLTLQTDQPAANKQFIDNSGNNLSIAQYGNATQGTFSPYGSNWSNYFDGSGDYLSVPSNAAFDFGTGNFTFEAWIYPTNVSGWNYICSQQTSGGFLFGLSSTTFYVSIYAGSNITFASSITANAWHHVAAVRSNGVIQVFLNGTSLGTSSTVLTIPAGRNFLVGASPALDLPFNGYISNFRAIKGTAVYTAAFTPPTAPLEPIPGTSLLTCQSSRIVDNSLNAFTITKTGDVRVQRFSPFSPVIQAPVSYSTYFDGSGDYLSAPDDVAFTMGSGDFTIECWINLSTLSGSQMVIGTADAPGNQGSMSFVLNVNSGTPRIGVGYGNAVYYATAASTITANTWVHLAGVRNGASVYIYVNGVQSTALNMASLAINDSTQIVAVGRNGNYNGEYVTGYISNVRIVKGTAVYTANFTPPTTPLTAVSGTSLLTCQSPTIIDNSTNAFPITVSGNAIARSQNPFGSTNTTTGTAYTPALYGGSAYFDGTGDYLSTPSLISASGDFTLECWFNTTIAVSGFRMLCGGNIDASASNYLGINASGVEAQFGSGSATVVTAAYTFVPNTWYHVAMTRSGTTIRIFVNGVSLTTSQGSQAGTFAIRYIAIGYNGITFTGYMADLRFVIGQAIYTGGFVPPIAPLQAVKNTTLLLNMDKSGVTDSSRCVDLETVGDAKIRYESPYSGSYYSNYFDGSGDYLSAPSNVVFDMSTNDFTWEAWVYPTQSTNGIGVISIGSIELYIRNSTGGNTAAYYDGSTVVVTSASAVTANQWSHIALVRSSGNLKIYLNGVGGTGVSYSSSVGSNSTCYIGVYSNLSSDLFTGYISNLRIVKGTAVYTANFTPPTSPLTAISGTSLLTCQSKSFVDNSSNNFTITRNGDVAVRSYNPFQANTANSSMYFDGTGDYLSSPTNPNFALAATEDYTVECWINFSVVQTCAFFQATNNISSASGQFWFGYEGGALKSSQHGSGTYAVSYTWAPSTGVWYHVAAVRASGTVRLFVNGVVVTTNTTAQNGIAFTQSGAAVGVLTTPAYFYGYLADLRFTKSARYTANFTPPTAPLPTA